jgi:hypothetical protein
MTPWAAGSRASPGARPSGSDPFGVAVHRVPDDHAELAEQRGSLLDGEVLDPAGWMDPGPPQRLVGQEVADAGEERLVQEGRLDASATAAEQPEELLALHAEGVRAQAAEELVDLAWLGGQPHAAELPHVPVPDLADIEDQDHPVVTVPTGGGRRPLNVTGHTEVQQQRRPIRRGDQPFASTLGIHEAMTAERTVELRCSHVPKDPGVGHDDLLDPPPDRSTGEGSPEVLDVREFGHGPIA